MASDDAAAFAAVGDELAAVAAPGAGPGDGGRRGRGGLADGGGARVGGGRDRLLPRRVARPPAPPPLLADAVVGVGGVATLDDVRVPAGARR